MNHDDGRYDAWDDVAMGLVWLLALIVLSGRQKQLQISALLKRERSRMKRFAIAALGDNRIPIAGRQRRNGRCGAAVSRI